MGSLDQNTIIITGGSVGIGFAVAKKCALEGATVIIVARNVKDLSSALIALKEISPKNHQFYSLDVSDIEEVGNFKKWCVTNHLQINGLVNCAGVYGPIGKTTEVNLDLFKEAFNINFFGTVNMCAIFAPIIVSESKKKIINFSGGGAATPFPNYSAYATSKIAVVRFTENLAIELNEDDFDINCIAPGFVVTRIHQNTLEAGSAVAGNSFFESTKKQIDSGGIPPEKAAELTTFLLSQESDGISGKFISAPWDPWQDKSFQDLLRSDKDIATLRRIDNKTFFKKS